METPVSVSLPVTLSQGHRVYHTRPNATVTKKAVSVRWECWGVWVHTTRVVGVGSGAISILSCGHIERSDHALCLDTADNPHRAETSGDAR